MPAVGWTQRNRPDGFAPVCWCWFLLWTHRQSSDFTDYFPPSPSMPLPVLISWICPATTSWSRLVHVSRGGPHSTDTSHFNPSIIPCAGCCMFVFTNLGFVTIVPWEYEWVKCRVKLKLRCHPVIQRVEQGKTENWICFIKNYTQEHL